MRLLGCPRNSKKLNVLSSACQPIGLTGFPPVLHSGEFDTVGGQKCPPCTARGTLLSAIEHGFRLGIAVPFGTRRSGSSHLEKDLVEVPAKNAKTLRGSLSPNDNPVAGANFRGLKLCSQIDAGHATRDAKTIRLPHTALGEYFYTIKLKSAQAQVY